MIIFEIIMKHYLYKNFQIKGVSELQGLEWLDISKNVISDIDELSFCKQITFLNTSCNKLNVVPYLKK